MPTYRSDESAPVDLLSEARRALLDALKRAGWATVPDLADKLSISTEAVRQQVTFLQREGWIIPDCGPDEEEERAPGRPATEYCLSPLADDLFPKRYGELAVSLFDQLPDPEQTLAAITDKRVHALRTSARENSGVDVKALQAIYREDDSYVEVEKSERGYRLIEGNCPYLQFARERPLFCSTTVSVLRRLTGCEVIREKRFQDGDGRCVFHIYEDAPLRGPRKKRPFEPEPARDAQPASARSKTRMR